MSIDQEISDGARARGVLESEAFCAAVARVQNQIIEDFQSCPPQDVLKLQLIRVRQLVLADIVRDLRSVVETAALAKLQLEEEERTKQAESAARAGDDARVRSIRGIF